MEHVYFGSDAWKNHSSYDSRYPDDHVYNRKALDISQQSQTKSSKAKCKKKGFQLTSYDDSDFIGGDFLNV